MSMPESPQPSPNPFVSDPTPGPNAGPIEVDPGALEAEPSEPRTPSRPRHRQYLFWLILTVAVGFALGNTLKQRVLLGPNTVSRWCTVWALLEQGTYAIDDCPWQERTIDKVKRPDPFAEPGEDDDPETFEPPERFYSSKPPLLPTMIAGLLYPARQLSGVPLDAVLRSQERVPQRVITIDDDDQLQVEIEEPDDPYEWTAEVRYFNLALIVLNVLPMAVFLVLYSRLLDRYIEDDWAWMFGLVAAAFGTNLMIFTNTLNNHTVAAYSGFLAIYAWLNIMVEGRPVRWAFLTCGFFASFCACNELPAASLLGVLGLTLLRKNPWRTLLVFAPAALVPLIAFAVTLYAATGGFDLYYAQFQQVDVEMNEEQTQEVLDSGSPYLYDGSYWLNPRELDAMREEKPVYLFHMLLGHHGIFSLTPIFLFSLAGLIRAGFVRSERRLGLLAAITTLLSVIVIAFYAWKSNNYGGSTQGLRWLFWLMPLWLIFLPVGLAGADRRTWLRGLSLVALVVSALTTGYGILVPWTHPWLLELLMELDLYQVVR